MAYRKTDMTYRKSFRQCMQQEGNELLVFGADNFAQFPRRDGSVSARCDRALAAAGKDDLVVLRGTLDHAYGEWLAGLGLGPDHVVEYGTRSREMTLSELIVANPEPVKKIIVKTGRKPVYVPWYSGNMESEAAKILGADLFGAPESITLKYNDKASFKGICEELEIPVVRGGTFEIYPDNHENFLVFQRLVNSLPAASGNVIIRGTLGEAGMSLYRTCGNDIEQLHRKIADSGEKVVIIEPFLDAASSPNDQWIIDRRGRINHLGMRQQICERGMVYIGTVKGEKASRADFDAVSNLSRKIVNHMARSGYVGIVGIDYIVTDQGVFPVENNARFNGSSYAGMIVENIEEKMAIPVPCWKFIKTATSPCTFEELAKKMESILYDGRRTSCVFPFNCKPLPVSGEFALILMAEKMDRITHMEESLGEMGIRR